MWCKDTIFSTGTGGGSQGILIPTVRLGERHSAIL